MILILSACATTAGERPLSVQEVVRRAQELDGREILVRGWIERCRHLSCALYASAEEVGKERPYSLSLGRARWFDSFASRRAPIGVTLRAKLDARCVVDPATDAIPLCSDRPATLQPIRFVW